MNDFKIKIGDIIASTEMIEEDVIRLKMRLNGKNENNNERIRICKNKR